MGKYRVEGFNYIQSESAKIKTGVKGNRVPQDAIDGVGGHGTFLVRGKPPQVKVYYDGGKQSRDIYNDLKDNLYLIGRSNVTESLAEKVFSRLMGHEFDNEDELKNMVIETMKNP